MEVDISGGSLRAFYRSVAFLARVGPGDRHGCARGRTILERIQPIAEIRQRGAIGVRARVRIARDAFDAFDVRAVGGRAQTCVLASPPVARRAAVAREVGRVRAHFGRDDVRVRVRTTSAAKGTTRTYEMYEVTDAEQLDADIEAEEMPVKLVAKAEPAMTWPLLAQLVVGRQGGRDADVRGGAPMNGSVGDAREAKVVTLSSYTNPSGGLSQALRVKVESCRRSRPSPAIC